MHVEHRTFVLFFLFFVFLFPLPGFGLGPAFGLRFLDIIRDHVDPRIFFFLWIDLDRFLAM